MANGNNILAQLERKQAISVAAPERHSALRTIAENLSRRNVDSAIVELFNEVLSRIVLLAYEQDSGGFTNIDSVTGRWLLPLPWGRNGHAKWQLRSCEANVLRSILFEWMLGSPPGAPALLFYDRSRRSWYVNLSAFPSAHIARAWLRAHPVTVAVYRAARAKKIGQ